MSKNNKWAMDPSIKENIKNKINAQIDKMKIAESKGDTEAIEKIMILKERIRLIDSYRPFDQVRIANLQKLFKHYCTHIFKTGKNMSFDRIEYENQHMTIQRFFAFVNDFKLNEIPVDDNNKQLTHPNNIILLFKKCSSTARNLQFHEFVACMERLFTLLFNQTQNYDRRQQKLLAQKKKRAQEAKKREKLRELKKRKKVEINQTKKVQKQEEEEEQQEQQEQEAPQNIKTADKKINQAKPNNLQPPQVNKPNEQVPNLPKSTQNDEMVKEMMKDFEIVNPTDEVKKAAKKIKKGDKKQEQQQEDAQPEVVFDPYAVTDQQKIESYMLRLGLDNWKVIQNKMRYFQKANHKFTEKIDPLAEAMKIKQQKLKSLKKDQLTHYENASLHLEWKGDRKNNQENQVKRLLSVKDKIEQIKMERSKSSMVESLPKEVYEKKKKNVLQTFQRRQRQLMVPNALARLTKRKEQLQQSSMNFSLQMINRSTPHHLQLNKINPERYAIPDPTDRIYMQQFGYDSFLGMKRSGRNDIYLAQQTKKRAQQLQNLEEKRMNRLSRNMYKRQQQNRQSLMQKRN